MMAEFLQSVAALVTAIGMVIGSTAALFAAMKEYRRQLSSSSENVPATIGTTQDSSGIARLLKMPAFDLGVLLGLLGIAIFVGRAYLPSLPLNAQLTADAWNLYNRGEYVAAVNKTEECIKVYRTQAIRDQENFLSHGDPLPPVGMVEEAVKTVIFSKGVLNDVATCYFIMGESLVKLDRIPEAKNAYTEAQTLTYARIWDPTSGFWSPADVAGDRLSELG